MTRTHNSLKGLLIFGSVLPLAIFLGYTVAQPLNFSSLTILGAVMLLLVTPLILRWHHPLLILAWNMTAVVPFVPGRPQFWMVMAFTSLLISVLQYTITRRVHFAAPRPLLYPLLFLGAVVLVTAFLTGGIGLGALGGSNIGGKRYLWLLMAIAGFLAMTACQIPKAHTRLYLGLFVLGALTNAVGNLLPYVPKALYPIFALFPVEHGGVQAVLSQEFVMGRETINRFAGLSIGMISLAYFLIARGGLDRLVDIRKPAFWLVVLALGVSMMGGYRSYLIGALLTMAVLAWLEGIHRSKKMPVILLAAVLGFVGVVAFSSKLPSSMQRTLSFLPIQVDPAVARDAEDSTNWRIQMWQKLLPEVPRHLLLGKGLSINREEMELVLAMERLGGSSSGEGSMLSGDYHNGPLSIVIPFGIWGVIGWIWFVSAGSKALYLNYRNGDPEQKTINGFLFAYFISKVVMFHTIFGSFHNELMIFTGILGFSMALNGGIREAAPETAKATLKGPLARPRLIPSFSRLGQR